jgi:nucleoside-diphosphate-sugar epimerase
MLNKVLVTGSYGYSGSAIARYFAQSSVVVGLDIGESPVKQDLQKLWNYRHRNADIRYFESIDDLIKYEQPQLVVQCAQAEQTLHAQFRINVLGATNLLESIRWHSPKCVYVLVTPSPKPFLSKALCSVVNEYQNFYRLKAHCLEAGQDDPAVIRTVFESCGCL